MAITPMTMTPVTVNSLTPGTYTPGGTGAYNYADFGNVANPAAMFSPLASPFASATSNMVSTASVIPTMIPSSGLSMAGPAIGTYTTQSAATTYPWGGVNTTIPGFPVMTAPLMPSPQITYMPVVRSLAAPLTADSVNLSSAASGSQAAEGKSPGEKILGEKSEETPDKSGHKTAADTETETAVSDKDKKPPQPKTFAQEVGHRVGDIVTQMIEANPQVEDGLRQANVKQLLNHPAMNKLIQDPASILEGIREPFKRSRLLRWGLNIFENKLVRFLPDQWEPAAHELIWWLKGNPSSLFQPGGFEAGSGASLSDIGGSDIGSGLGSLKDLGGFDSGGLELSGEDLGSLRKATGRGSSRKHSHKALDSLSGPGTVSLSDLGLGDLGSL